MARDFQGSFRWVPATIVQRLGPVSFMMQLANGYIWKLHMDQVKALVEKEEETKESVLMDSEPELFEDCDTGVGATESDHVTIESDSTEADGRVPRTSISKSTR